MIEFSYIHVSGKLKTTCSEGAIFEKLREHFSVENTDARFARRYSKFVPRRKYAITHTGVCDLGLFWEIKQYLLKEKVDITVTDELQKELTVGKGTQVNLYRDFALDLREYQEDVIKKALKLGRGTCVLGTGAGKTFTTAALIENYFQSCADKDTFKCVVLVPDLGLVSQTYDEFLNCGTTFKLTKWTGKTKPDLTANVVICNIGIVQSRFKENDWIKYVDLLIVDECHKVKASNKISKIISKIKTHNKYGFTGTLPENQLDKWSIIGKFGPVIYEKSSYELRLEDYLANVLVGRIPGDLDATILIEDGNPSMVGIESEQGLCLVLGRINLLMGKDTSRLVELGIQNNIRRYIMGDRSTLNPAVTFTPTCLFFESDDIDQFLQLIEPPSEERYLALNQEPSHEQRNNIITVLGNQEYADMLQRNRELKIEQFHLSTILVESADQADVDRAVELAELSASAGNLGGKSMVAWLKMAHHSCYQLTLT